MLVPFKVLVYCTTAPYLGGLPINYLALQGTPLEFTSGASANAAYI